MTALAIARPAFNVLVNSGIACCARKITVNDEQCRDVAIIVAIDTAFRIAITHALDALEIPYLQKGVAGHLLFPCLTLITQPISVAIAHRLFSINERWSTRQTFIATFGYIAVGWKANMMLKDVMYLCSPSLLKS